MYLTTKKVDYIFEELLHLHILLVGFFSPPSGIAKEIRAKLKKTIYFEQQTEVGVEYRKYKYRIHLLFFIGNCSDASAFLN